MKIMTWRSHWDTDPGQIKENIQPRFSRVHVHTGTLTRLEVCFLHLTAAEVCVMLEKANRVSDAGHKDTPGIAEMRKYV